jgi:class 3 adenylate cyclase
MRADLQRLKRDTESSNVSAAPLTAFPAPKDVPSPIPAASIPAPPSDSPSIRTLEMAHILFTDIVAYSRLPMDRQEQALLRLQEAVRATQEFKRAQISDQLIRLPTGDGMALVFFGDVAAPVRCALELHRILRQWPEMKLRMGIHTGPVYRVEDINAARNVAGGGINIAQRVMDCGDAGHILISKSVADVLDQVSTWKTALHDLGETEVKHGVRVHLYNLYTDEDGNREPPQKLRTAQRVAAAERSESKKMKLSLEVVAAAVIAALVVSTLIYFLHGVSEFLKSTFGASLAFLGTLVVAFLGYRQWKKQQDLTRYGSFLSERQTAYKDLWQKLEAVHLSVRSEEFREKEFHELVRAVNIHMIHAGLHLDRGEKARVNDYLVALGKLGRLLADSAATNAKAEAQQLLYATLVIPKGVLAQVAGLREAYAAVEEKREALIIQFRKVLRPDSHTFFQAITERIFASRPRLSSLEITRKAERITERQQRVLEAATSKQSAVGRSTEVIVMVRRTDSAGMRAILAAEEMPTFTCEDVRERGFELEFPLGADGEPQSATILLRLESPDFEPRSQNKSLRVPPKGDSVPCSFFITPRVPGELVVNLELLRGEEVVVSRSIRMRAEPEGVAFGAGKHIVTIPLTVVVHSSGQGVGVQSGKSGTGGAGAPAQLSQSGGIRHDTPVTKILELSREDPSVLLQEHDTRVTRILERSREDPSVLQRLEKFRREITVMFTDIKGSTMYFDHFGDIAGLAMVHEFNDRLRLTIEHHGGRVIKTIGDMVMAAFDDYNESIRAAIEMQRRVRERNASRTKEDELQVRIGLHYGIGIVQSNDVLGDVVKVASRVESIAEAGQIIISDSLRERISPTQFNVVPLGRFRLKGKSERELFQVRWTDP